ncbi:MAG: class I SAM-dependent methyltransferase [Proteobacteria bacterium]|nr:class I SAM-dependent methyltransferase [Pseudomonadota bacterium]
MIKESGNLYKFLAQNILYLNFVKAREAKIIFKFLDLKKGEKVCDIACGSGQQSIKMEMRGCKVQGIDLSSRAIENAKLIAKGHDCTFQVGNAEKLPYASNIFDKVVSVCALEHFKNDEKALKEANRVLKSDGILVLTVDSFTYKGIKKDIQDKHKKDCYVNNYYSLTQLTEKLEKCGFEVEESKYFINSSLSSFFFDIGLKIRSVYIFALTFPIAYSTLQQFWKGMEIK